MLGKRFVIVISWLSHVVIEIGDIRHCTESAKYLFFGKCFKNTIEYFLKFLFLFESTILAVNTYLHIILFSHATCLHTRLTEFYWTNVSSRTTDQILTETPLPTLPRFLYPMISSLMNALVGDCFWLRVISINVNNLFIVYFVYVRPWRIVVAIYQLF